MQFFTLTVIMLTIILLSACVTTDSDFTGINIVFDICETYDTFPDFQDN